MFPRDLDWARATVVVAPEGDTAGFWVGAADVYYCPVDRCFWLYYRIRRPIDPTDPRQRGSRCRIARSDDGIHLEDVWELEAKELGSISIEKGCFDRSSDGRARLYLSYECPEGKGWQIDLLEADRFDGFDAADRQEVLHPRDIPEAGHVKDPVVLHHEGRTILYANIHRPTRGSGEVTGYATSEDGVHFAWQGTLLELTDDWDSYTARVTDVVHRPPHFVMLYDGASTNLHLFEEECGLALGETPFAFERVTKHGPLFRQAPRWDVLHPDGPWLASPGSVRYVLAVEHEDRLLVYGEYTRENGSHDVRVVVT